VIPRIVLVGHSPSILRQRWVSEQDFEIGRLPDAAICMNDNSVSRTHASVLLQENGWVIRDQGSSNGTFVNGTRVGRTGQKLRESDVITIGEVDLRVESLVDEAADRVKLSAVNSVRIQASASRSWDVALDGLFPSEEQWGRQGKEFLSLLRSGYRMCHATSMDQSLSEVREATIAFFKAQRGGILLAEPASGELAVRALAFARKTQGESRTMSKTLATRAFRHGKSLLYQDCSQDVELQAMQSVARSSMASIVCAVLRSPEKPLGVLHLDRGPTQQPFAESDLYLADSLAVALSLSIERLQMSRGHQDLFVHTITALAQAVEMRDESTGHHTHRVTTYSLMLGDALGVSESERRLLQVAAPLHDIGKIGIEDQILRKPESLSSEEFGKMKSHVTRGADIIQMIPGLADAMPIIRHHHERWDGTGYPDRLAGEKIPRLARIVAVADAFDAMTSDRPYRLGLSLDHAFAEVARQSGTHFDPKAAQAFLGIRKQIEALLQSEQSKRQLSATVERTLQRAEMLQIVEEVRSAAGPEKAPV